ncbi:MAG: CesT family type III secretion system chaperone [Desulfovibrionaceae bacterium]|jgi:type III secretion system chaperone SycN|nr:CesT family type III secretion system chaperone [Desulfovibrionaceae bacterium]
MNWIKDTVRDFGRSMGLDGLEPNDRGVVCLAFERLGTLFIEQEDDDVLVYAARGLPPYSGAAWRAALEACHWTEGLPWPVNAGMRGDDVLVFLARLPGREFALPALERTLEMLGKLHDAAAEAAR